MLFLLGLFVSGVFIAISVMKIQCEKERREATERPVPPRRRNPGAKTTKKAKRHGDQESRISKAHGAVPEYELVTMTEPGYQEEAERSQVGHN